MHSSLREFFVNRRFLLVLFFFISFSANTANVSADLVPPATLGATANQWTSRTSAADNNWTSIAYGNGVFVAVSNSGTGNRIMTSSDGITWTPRTSPADNAWNSVTYGNGLFVAVACGINYTACTLTSGNRIMTSPDGITWTARTAPTENFWNSVTYGNGLFVAFAPYAASVGSLQTVMTSPDGITWTSRTPGVTTDWTAISVTYGNGKFVAVNGYQYGTYHFLYSSDGITWTTSGPQYDYYSWNSVTYGNGRFVAVSNTGRVNTSPDGITWTAYIGGIPSNNWTSVTYGNGLFVAVANSGTGNRVMTSPDGITWTARTSAADISWTSVTYGNGMFVGVSNTGTGNRVMTSESAASISPDNTQVTANYITPVDGDLHSMIVLRSASAVVATPTTGVTYTVGNTIGASTVACVDTTVATSTADSCVITGLSNGTPYHFKIFAEDTSGNYSTGAVPTGSPATPNPTITLGSGTDPASASIVPGASATSSDSFTFQTSYGTQVISALVVNFGSATTSPGIALVEITSDDGATVYGSVTNPTSATTSITLNTNTLTANTTPTQYKIRITPKTHANMPAPAGGTYIYIINAKVDSWTGGANKIGTDTSTATITIDNQSPVLMPNDGSVWRVGASAQDNTWYGIAYGNGMFVAVSYDGTNRIMTSPDGITWTSRSSPESNMLMSVTYGNGLFVAVAQDGTYQVITSPDGITWTGRSTAPGTAGNGWLSVTYGNGLFVAVAQSGTYRVMTSTDGITWTARTAASASSWTGVAYGNGMYVAVADSAAMSSPDGITWTSRTPAENNQWLDVTYGKGLFVAVAQTGTNRVMTSPDGITWTARTVPASYYYWDGVTYGNGLFVATSYGWNSLMTSTDGITWIQRTPPADNGWGPITYGNGFFVSAAGSGTGNRAMVSGTTMASTTPADTQVTVNYTTPADNDLDSIVVLRSTSEIVALPVEGTTYSVGNTIGAATVACIDTTIVTSTADSCTATGLSNGTTYYFKVFAKDSSGNYSIGFSPPPVAPGAATTLGTGTDPSDAAIVPGSSATMAGAFTIQTSQGSVQITSLVVNFGSATATPGIALVEITSDNGATVYGSTANPTNATTSVTLNANTLTATTTSAQYKIRITPKTHANMPAAPGTTYTMNAKVDSWVGGGRWPLGSDTASTTITIDNQAPGIPSDIGTVWTLGTGAANNQWYSVTYGNGLFVAVSVTGTGNRVMTSPDGITWTSRTSASDNQWWRVTYGNGLFVAVSVTGTGNRVMTSPDGITWTSRTSAADNQWRGLTYGNGMFVAVSGDGTNRAMTSPNGITWTLRTTPVNTVSWNSVTYGNGLFVAVSGPGTNTQIMTSPDGITWTARVAGNYNGNAIQWQDITYGNGLFVVSGDGNQVMSSYDGINWNFNQTPVAYNGKITYGNGLFAAITSDSSGRKIMTSPDAVNWTLRTTGSLTLFSIAYGNGLFVAVTQSVNQVSTSGMTTPAVAPADSQVAVSYVTPADADLHSVIVLRSTSAVVDVPVEGTTYSVGNTIGAATVACVDTTIATSTADSCTATGLSNGTAYHFKVFTRDTNGNYSAGIIPIGSPVTPAGVTTLSNGSDPASTTVAPGSGAVIADTFIFQDSESTKNISAAVVNLGSATAASGLSLVEIVSDNEATVYGSVANPTTATTSITGLGMSVTTSPTQYKIRITPKTHANMSAVPGETYTINAKIDSWTGGENLQAGSDTASTTITIDNQSPLPTISGLTWATSTSAADNNWASVTYGNGLFVAVAQSGIGNRVMTSPDGITWTSRTSAANSSWSSVTYGNGKFVVVDAYLYDQYHFMYSSDGITWTTAGPAYDYYSWTSVTYGNGKFVAVSTTNRVMTSPDGITWTATTPLASNYWASVTYGNGLFVAVACSINYTSSCNGTAGNRVATSPDGITWTSRTTPADNYWNSITYGNGMFVAVAGSGTGNRVMTSPDGITWTSRTSAANNNWYGVTYGNGLFVAVAQSGTGNRVMQSRPSASVVSGDSVATVSYTTSADADLDSIVALRSTSAVVDAPVEGTAYSVGNTIGAATVACIDSAVATSTADTCVATGLSNGTAYHFKIFAKDANGNYSAGVVPTGSPVTPAQVTTLTTGTDPGNTTVSPEAGGAMAGAFVFQTGSGSDIISSIVVNLGSSATATSGVALIEITSDNGATVYGSAANPTNATTSITLNTNTLTANTTPTQYKIRITPKTHANMPAVPGETYTVNAKVDSWTGGANKSGTDTAGATITIDNQSPVTTANDGVTWTSRTSAADNSWESVTYGNGLFVAVSDTGTGNRVMTSPDGITWTSRTSAANNSWNSVTYGNGLFVAVAYSGTGNRVMTSPDGVTWTIRASAANYGWYEVTYGNNLFVAVSTDGHVMTSPDGITWTLQTSPGLYSWQGITYGNGLFVVVGTSGGSNTHIITSPDGITWTARTSAADNWWQGVVYGNGLFVAVSNSGTGNRVMTSPDGITWTSRTSAANNNWTSVTYGNGLFVAAANTGTGNRVMTSPDGITWTLRTSAADNNWYGLTYGNGLFVAVSASGTGNRVMQSGLSASVATDDSQATVSYTTSADADLDSIVALRSTSAVTDVPVEGTTYSVGNTIGAATVACIDSVVATSTADTCTATGLSNGTAYHFKIFAKDANGNYSAGVVPTGSPVTPGPAITLGAGTDPSDANLLPGSSATMAGAFTFQTSSGTGPVSSLVVNLGSVAAASGVALVEITSDNGATVYGSSTNPTNATTSITLNTNTLTANTTPTQYKIRITPKTHANMPAAPGALYTVNAKVDSWTGGNPGNSGSDAASTTVMIDNASPSSPSGVSLLPGFTQLSLSYTGGTESDLHSAVVLRSTSAVVDTPVEGTTYTAGNTIGASTVACADALAPSTSGTCTMTGLVNGTPYYFKVFTRDITGNYSTGVVPTGSPMAPGLATLLDTGTDPSSTTIAPGGSATMAGAFTFQASSGSDTISAVVVNLGSALAASGVSLVEITSDNGATVYGSSTNPTNATTSITLTGLTAITTPTQYKIRITSKTHTDMPAVPGTLYPVNAKVDSWTGQNASRAGTDTSNTTITIDNLSPGMLGVADVTTWTARTSASDDQWNSVTYGNGLFVAVATNGTGNSVMTSPDGITWTLRTNTVNTYWSSITYGNGLFVAVSSFGTGNRVMTSPDGITWTTRTNSADNSWSSVTYGNGLFVAVSRDGTGNRVMTSPDGITWTSRTSAADNSWRSVTYGNGLFVAVSDTGTGNRVMTSPDGITWTSRTSAADNSWMSVTYGNGLFVAVSNSSNAMTSPDGITWTSRAVGTLNAWVSVTYGNGNFVAVSYNGTGNRVMTSPDGITWTTRTSAADNSWSSIAYGQGLFVGIACGIGGTCNTTSGARVMTSGLTPSTLVTPGDTQTIISYTTPSDQDISSVLVLRSTSPVAAVPLEGASYSVGNTIGASTVACVDTTVTASSTSYCSATGLSNGTAYHFKVFARDTNGNYSMGIVPTGSPVTASTSATIDESAYRFFASSTTATPGTAMAAQNTSATLGNAGDAFRMRLTLHAGSSNVPLNGRLFKLQYAQKAGTCDAGFVGENYSDITSTTPISYYNVSGLNDNILLGNQADLTHGADTIVDESFVEANPFINSQAIIPAGQDGKFDFSLYENGAPGSTSYCIRAVNVNGTALNSYSVIPEITTASQQVQLVSYRWRKDDGNETSATYASSENGAMSSTFVAGDKVRIRFAVSNTGSALSNKSYQLEYATSSCTQWTQVPRTVDVTYHHWRTEPSIYVPDNGATTHSAGLSTPNGKSFVPGKIQTFNNVTQPIALKSNEFTEIEYSIRSTTNITPSVQYCFRVSAIGDSSVFTYPVTPQITPAMRIFRYQSGGGGGGSLNTVTNADNSNSPATTTVIGGGVRGGAASSTEPVATSTDPTSTTTPSQGGGGGDVGYLFGQNGFAFNYENDSWGMVLGDSAQNMCVDMRNRMLTGSRDETAQGEVSELQYFLRMRGYFNSNVTGYYGKITAGAVRKFQGDNGLGVNGIMDKATRNKMKEVGCSANR